MEVTLDAIAQIVANIGWQSIREEHGLSESTGFLTDISSGAIDICPYARGQEGEEQGQDNRERRQRYRRRRLQLLRHCAPGQDGCCPESRHRQYVTEGEYKKRDTEDRLGFNPTQHWSS